MIKYLKSLRKTDANEIGIEKDRSAFNTFLEGIFNLIDQPQDLNENLRNYYVIFCYMIYNLKKIESVMGFDQR